MMDGWSLVGCMINIKKADEKCPVHVNVSHGRGKNSAFPASGCFTVCNFQSFPTGGFYHRSQFGARICCSPCDPAECVVTRASPLCCVFIEKSLHACLEYILSPIRRQLAQQIDAAVGFLAICKSAVTVMGAAQRCRRCGKCQAVRKDWYRTSELGASPLTRSRRDKAGINESNPHIRLSRRTQPELFILLHIRRAETLGTLQQFQQLA